MKKRNSQKKRKSILEEISLTKLQNNRQYAKTLTKYHVSIFHQLQEKRDLKREQIINALQSENGISVDITNWVRIIDMCYSTSPVSPKGSNTLVGGRFNIGKDVHPDLASNYSLYIAESEDTAFCEKYPEAKNDSNLTQEEIYLLTKSDSFGYMKLDGHINNIFDLTDEKFTTEFISIISKFKINKLTQVLAKVLNIDPWKSVQTFDELLYICMEYNWRFHPTMFDIPSSSQVFGNLIRQSGFAGIKYKSTKGHDYCLSLFPENFDDQSEVIAKSTPPETKFSTLNNENWTEQI